MWQSTRRSEVATQSDSRFANTWFRFLITCRNVSRVSLQTISTDNARQTYMETVITCPRSTALFITRRNQELVSAFECWSWDWGWCRVSLWKDMLLAISRRRFGSFWVVTGCWWQNKERRSENETELQQASSELSKLILSSEAKGNKTKEMNCSSRNRSQCFFLVYISLSSKDEF